MASGQGIDQTFISTQYMKFIMNRLNIRLLLQKKTITIKLGNDVALDFQPSDIYLGSGGRRCQAINPARLQSLLMEILSNLSSDSSWIRASLMSSLVLVFRFWTIFLPFA